jgi:membrane-associated HD superfamily phosphohydrolase
MNWFSVLKRKRRISDPRKGKNVKRGLTEEQKKKYGFKSADAEYYKQKRIATAKEAEQDRLDGIIRDFRDSITDSSVRSDRFAFDSFKQKYDKNVKLKLDSAKEQLKATEFFMQELEKNPKEYFINMNEARVNDPSTGLRSDQLDEYRKNLEERFNSKNLEENIKEEESLLRSDKKETKEYIQKTKQSSNARQVYEKILDQYDGSHKSFEKVIEEIEYESRYPTYALYVGREKYYLKYFKGGA